jgi:hypothetical protein
MTGPADPWGKAWDPDINMKLRRSRTSFVFYWGMLLAWFAGCGTLLAGLAQERGADSQASIHASATQASGGYAMPKGFTLAYRTAARSSRFSSPAVARFQTNGYFRPGAQGRRPPNLQGTVIEIPVRRVAHGRVPMRPSFPCSAWRTALSRSPRGNT